MTDNPVWKFTVGYTINVMDGMAGKCSDGMCTLHFYHAYPGDRLVQEYAGCVYRVLVYEPRADEKYIYTYDYQQEENWTSYDPLAGSRDWIQGEYVFEKECYFRVNIQGTVCVPADGDPWEWLKGKKAPVRWEQGEREQTMPDVHRGQKFSDVSPVFEEEIAKTIFQVKQMEETLAFLLLSDTHYTVGGTWKDTIWCLRRVAEGITPDGIIHLGDATDGMVPEEITRDYVRGMQEDMGMLGIPLYYVLGNHDSNYFRGNPEAFAVREMYDLYLGEGSTGYGYQDYREHSLRLIFLESFDFREKVRYGYSEEELDWLGKRLDDTPREWHVVVFSHVPPVARLHYWSDTIRGSRKLVRLLKRFQYRSGGRLLGFVHGHNHCDGIDIREGFPILSIGCAKCEYFVDKKPEGAQTWPRKPGSVSQELWDVLVISTKKRCLDLVRFGAGSDRRIVSIPLGRDGAVCEDGTVYEDRTVPEDTMERNAERGFILRTYTDTRAGAYTDTCVNEEAMMTKVITYGTYDLFHEGHYNLLKRAKELGDYLIVGVTTEHYDQQRGKLNVIDSLLDRIENVRKTGLADEIIIEDHDGQKIEDIQKYQADIFTLGSDWRGMFDYLKAFCEVVYLDRTPDISSTMLRKEKFPIIRTGIVGTGRIAPRFVAEAKYVSGLHMRSAYNPHRDSVMQFAKQMGLEGYSDSFEEFLDSVDAIYIATPHETHYEYAKKALLMGKHVLCEKPLAFSRKEAEELFAIAREKDVVLMEGIKTAYCPGFTQIINIAQSGKIGEIRDVEACFSRLTDPALREMMDYKYGGAFLEFGSYTLLPIIKLLGKDYRKIEINSILAENGVDLYTKVHFTYDKGLATSKTGVGVKSEGQLLISGTKGYILAESPWWLTRKFQIRYEDPAQIETYTPNFMGDGLRYEINEFVSIISGHSGHRYRLTEEDSVAMADVVERFMENRKLLRQEIREKNRATGMKTWAHRGCSLRYPENTLAAFRAACEMPGITGIELDIQLSKDGEVMVFHDETLDRLMDHSGYLKDYTCEELQQMRFRAWKYEREEVPGQAGSMDTARIPRMEEVLSLVQPYALEKGLMINIELKNSRIPYEGMEEKILSLVKQYGMEPYVIYSSFSADSVRRLKELAPGMHVGILAGGAEECLARMKDTGADAIHPGVESVLEGEDKLSVACPVRVWNTREPFYRQNRYPVLYDLEALAGKGVTDFITNMPEEYLS